MLPQRAFIERVRGDLDALEVVRGVWLTGSFGRGTADAHSDVDMFVLVPAEQRDRLADGWPSVAGRYEPLLVKRLGAAPVFTHVLPGWLRWDVVIGNDTDLAGVDRRRVEELFNKDGASPGSPGHRGADPDVVREMTEEFLRVLGLLPVVVLRGELVAAVAGAELLRQLLVTLLRYRAEGPRLSGALHLSQVLPADEMAALSALPPVYAERSAVIRAPTRPGIHGRPQGPWYGMGSGARALGRSAKRAESSIRRRSRTCRTPISKRSATKSQRSRSKATCAARRR